jgi:hypothetical protein
VEGLEFELLSDTVAVRKNKRERNFTEKYTCRKFLSSAYGPPIHPRLQRLGGMSCKLCSSDEQLDFAAEVNLTFPGSKRIGLTFVYVGQRSSIFFKISADWSIALLTNRSIQNFTAAPRGRPAADTLEVFHMHAH